MTRALRYLNDRYVEDADLSGLGPWHDEIVAAGIAEDRERYRKAVRGYVRARAPSIRPGAEGSSMSSCAEWWHQEGEPWDEEEAIRLMQEAAVEVALYEEGGARMLGREHYHARIEGAHRVRNMEAYREAINGYATSGREAHRQKAHRNSRRRSGA